MPKTVTFSTLVLENGYVRCEADVNVFGKVIRIAGDHKRDEYNLPRFFTTNRRGLDRQWLHLIGAFTDEMSYSQAMSALRQNGAKVHDYCSMD